MSPDLAAIRRATLIGGTAVLMWATLALLATWASAIPPFQLTGMAFAVAFLIGLGWMALQGRSPLDAARQRPAVWLLGIGGLFGYHLVFFMALRLAPPVEAQLICYLWPLLIVLFSAFLPDERLRPHHLFGVLSGLAGTAVLIAGGGGLMLATDHAPGLAAAFVAAFVWATYSVLSRRFADVPSDAVGGFCLVTSALAVISHVLFEPTHWPENSGQWLAVVALGIGPVGAAFYVWDIGMKRGDIRVLGAASYAAPVLSTGFLVLAGVAEASPELAIAAALISAGGLIAAKDMLRPKVGAP